MDRGGESSGGGGAQLVQSPFGGVSKPSIYSMQNHNLDGFNSKRFGIPPSHPNNPQIIGSRSGSQQLGSQNLTRGTLHSRSLSQSSMSAADCLPPLSPLPYSSSLGNQNDFTLTDMSMEDGSSGNAVRVSDGLPPRKRGHRRSSSDSVPLAFSAMIQSSPQLIPIGSRGLDRDGRSGVGEGMDDKKSEGEIVDDLLNSYMNLEILDSLNSSAIEDKDLDSRNSGTKTNGAESSDNEVESRVKGNLSSKQGTGLIELREGLKRSAVGDISPVPRHRRSLSMDSYIGDLQFDDDFLNLPAMGTQSGQQSPRNSLDGSLNKMNFELGNGEFSEVELKKIMTNEKLSEIAVSDPKRVKRILANRLSAARSKERKMRYISELEQKVQTLQTEATTLSAQVTVLQRDSATLTTQNNELKFRLQAMEQQAQLKEALNEALVAEVQRLRVTAADLRGGSHQHLPPNHETLFRYRASAAHPAQDPSQQQQQQKDMQHQAQRN